MNDAQTDKLLKVLANAFDRAATTCATKEHAALKLLAAAREAGFKIEPRKL